MHISKIYKEIYKRFDSVTPLHVDCGELCDKLCCRGDDESGMYLFPGEARLFYGNKNFSVLPTDLAVQGKEVKLLVCHGPCSRMDRPLACRIFPLFPYYTRQEGLKIITDPRAVLCPLSHPSAAPYIRSDFKKRIEKTFRLLLKFPEIADYLEAISESFRDFERLKGSF
ncbi:MAG: hypothetical protein IKL80_04455 [Clostridia bacterium]|nr:hypothetical protein [Clostridia bacterium]